MARRLKPGRKAYIVWDNEIPCFGVRISRTGSHWYLMRFRDGHDYRLGGRRLITPARARKLALLGTDLMRQGVHPAAVRRILGMQHGGR